MIINLFLKTYFAIILSISVTAISLFSLGAYCLLRRFFSLKDVQRHVLIKNETQDFSAIAGEDVITTQLDLARAYIETNQKELALVILKQVKRKGSPLQKQEAQELLNYL